MHPAPRKPSGLAKRLAFASPDISITVLYATVNSWLLYYLVNIAGLEPALAGFAFAFGRAFDACIDPYIGRWIDNSRAASSRKRVIRIAICITAGSFLLVWYTPTMFGDQWAKGLVAALAFAVFASAYSATNVTRFSMLPDYEPDHHGRTQQIAINMTFVFLTLLIVIAGVPAFITSIDSAQSLAGTDPGSWLLVMGILACVACIAFVPFLRIVPDRSTGLSSRNPVSLSAVLKLPGVWPVVVAFSLSAMGLATVQSMLPFFLESYLGLERQQHAPILGVVFGVSLLSMPFWVVIGRKLGKRSGLLLGLVVFMLFVANTSTLQSASGVTSQLLASAVLAGASVAAMSLFPWSMVPDIADRFSVTNGQSGEGLSAATFMFFNQMSVGIAILLNSQLLAMGGHVGGQSFQSEEATFVIYTAMTVLPLGIALLCLAAALKIGKDQFGVSQKLATSAQYGDSQQSHP